MRVEEPAYVAPPPAPVGLKNGPKSFATRYANAMSTSTAQQNIFFGRMDMDQSKGLNREEILRSALAMRLKAGELDGG